MNVTCISIFVVSFSRNNNMFFLKLLLILFISYYFDTAYSFTNPADLKSYYEENVEKMEEVAVSICQFPKEKWAGVCYNVFKKLRKHNSYKYKLFVSYKPFSDFDEILESKCITQKFFFESSLEKIGDSQGLMQKMVPCFGRPALVKSNVHYYDYEYYDVFMTYPSDNNSLYVFKRIPNSMDFFLLEILGNIKWREKSIAVDSKLFILPPPTIIELSDPNFLRRLEHFDLMEMSTDPRNIINTNNEALHWKIKTTLMKTFENDKLFAVAPEDMINRRAKNFKVHHLCFFHPDTNKAVLKDVNMYSCPTWNPKIVRKPNISLRFSYVWQIAAATTFHSVFILKFNNRLTEIFKKSSEMPLKCASRTLCQAVCSSIFLIEALVENLEPEFISYII